MLRHSTQNASPIGTDGFEYRPGGGSMGFEALCIQFGSSSHGYRRGKTNNSGSNDQSF